MRQVELEKNLLQKKERREERDRIAKSLQRHGREKEALTEEKPFLWRCALKRKGPTAEEVSANDLDWTQWPVLHAQAIGALTSPLPLQNSESKLKEGIFTHLYTGCGSEGSSCLISHDPGFVYCRIHESMLLDVLGLKRIDSLYVEATAGEVAGEVILFKQDHFEGRYTRFTTSPGAPIIRNKLDHVGLHIDNSVSSILLLRRYGNENTYPIRASLTALGGLGAIEDRINSINPSRIEMHGEVMVTWDMWPNGSVIDGNLRPNDDRRFIWVRIPVRVNASFNPDRRWINYEAEIQYWIYLWVDGAGNLRGHIAYAGLWIENGSRRGGVREIFEDFLPAAEAEVDNTLNSTLTVLNQTGPFCRQYFLPGTAVATGDTTDDVTLVLVHC